MSFDFSLIDGDLGLSPSGEVKTLTDTPKLRQDVLKIVLTPLGSNRFHPWYGCSVSESIIGNLMPDNLIEMEATATITQSLERLKQLQLAQATSQSVSLAELISSIGPVRVSRSVQDLRQLNIIVTVLTKRLTKIEEVFIISS